MDLPFISIAALIIVINFLFIFSLIFFIILQSLQSAFDFYLIFGDISFDLISIDYFASLKYKIKFDFASYHSVTAFYINFLS